MDQSTTGNLATMVDYWERLQAAITHAGVTLRDLQLHLDVSYQAMKKVADGKTKSLSAENNAHAARFLKVNSHWLATGQETMTSPESQHWKEQPGHPPLSAQEANATYLENRSWPFESVSYTDYARLSERQKGLIEGYIKRLIEESEHVKSNSRHKAA